ncbi:MAG TPA: SMP-30/gluconolactonase/LRE family protein [Balneolaceae bacterium]|nr:SMP-30/gluconolactonase/LRE family protein [Balneolaceae bacterium]
MSIKTADAKLELEFEAWLGEGPVWDEREKKLFWVDILSGKLIEYDPIQKSNTVYEIGEDLGVAALRKQGGLLLATQSGFYFFDRENGEKSLILNPKENTDNFRFNDGKCDPQGRIWAGTLSYDLEEGAGNLYCLRSDLQAEIMLKGLTIPNGMAWNSQRTKFYFIDSPTQTIFQFDYDDKTGGISNKQVVRVMKSEEGSPDGMTIDVEDKLWVALYNGSKVIRIDPEDGKTLFEVHLPVPRITSCTFGGERLDELYITTAREHMTEEEIAEFPLSGSLFKVTVPFKGVPVFRFDG